ncbi:asparaginase [Larsenimonas rhizosphaerae]|uniref:asparaginase n=1 Tax=Larsenimonas rhizosphaerae TaxID=2944682 RepID=UPI0020337E55|nr:asparaginase [Larsenimonas rhizosphaerae]MCM2131150.1 asparaginase [Larsenimonas rhizosphaerae]
MTQPVHVLYTGGTIGMQLGPRGLAPAAGLDLLARDVQQQSPALKEVPEWEFTSLSPLIDSANMTPLQWISIARATREAVEKGASGVVILHGTDTLAFSAAALRFWLMDVSVPVIITGAMLPAGAPDSDAWENFFGSLKAIADAAPGVGLYFHGTLLPATRTRKVRSHGRHAFQAVAGDSGPATAPADRFNFDMPDKAQQVGIVPLYPGFDASILTALIDSGRYGGVVLECFGSGTGPGDDPAFMAALERARQAGILLVAVSQCLEGGIMLDIYEAGQQLRAAGVISGGDMTRETALAKLHFLLHQSSLDETRRRQLMETNLCGELSPA